MRLFADVSDTSPISGRYIEFLYTLRGNNYMVGYKANFVGMSGILDANTKYLVLNWDANMERQEKSLRMERMNSTIYYKYFEDKVDYLTET